MVTQKWVPTEQAGITTTTVDAAQAGQIMLPRAGQPGVEITLSEGDYIQLDEGDNHLFGWAKADLESKFVKV